MELFQKSKVSSEPIQLCVYGRQQEIILMFERITKIFKHMPSLIQQSHF